MIDTKYLLYILFLAIQAISHKDHQTNVLATENKNLRNKQQMIMLFFRFIQEYCSAFYNLFNIGGFLLFMQ